MVPRPRPGAVPTPGAPGELEGKRRPSGQRRGAYKDTRFFVCSFDGTSGGMHTCQRLVTMD